MAEKTEISWCDATFNPWVGCAKISQGCLNCYAETLMDKRYHRVKWGKGNPRSRTSEANWKEPLKWNRDCEKNGTRIKVFCASLADWLDDEVPLYWLADLIALIVSTPNLDWLLLTKRPQNWESRLKAVWIQGLAGATPHPVQRWLDGEAPSNVWMGTTIENQTMADDRIPLLMQIPARLRFLSVEPLLESVDLKLGEFTERNGEIRPGFAEQHDDPANCPTWYDWCNCRPDWIIVGGESGTRARPCQVEWIRSTVGQCKAANVPVFVKQLGSNPVFSEADHPTHFPYCHVTGKGVDIEEFPGDLKIREFPCDNYDCVQEPSESIAFSEIHLMK